MLTFVLVFTMNNTKLIQITKATVMFGVMICKAEGFFRKTEVWRTGNALDRF